MTDKQAAPFAGLGKALKEAFPPPEREPEVVSPWAVAAGIVTFCFVIAVIMLTIKLGLVLF